MLNVFITNLGRYTEGELVGKWFTLPSSEEELQEAINEVLGANYEEYFLTDWESELKINVQEYSNLYSINETLQELEAIPEDDREVVAMIADYEGLELTDVIQEWKAGKYMVFPCESYEALGEYLNNEGLLGYEIPEHLESYIDFESVGEDWLHGGNFIELDGYYVTY